MTTLRVNGVEHEVQTNAAAALLWALRDELGCASAKYGCGVGQCGACRVLIDGVPDSSCQTTVSDATGHDITTLEGFVADGRAAPIVDALLAVDAGQCGYCLPGIATTLIALHERGGAPPARDVIVRALDDHLCRCGSQPRILAAAFAAFGVADG
ncbi:MAG TPA: 2Fe-2S iron-sulfur cluster-binding protein [Acidimicrobiia bacterium]|jgi:nicotinate dehydrogenase subunit A